MFLGFPGDSAGKESTCNVGDLGSVTGLGRCPREGKGYPLQYSGLENSMDCIVHGVAESWIWLSDFHFHFLHNVMVTPLKSRVFILKSLPLNLLSPLGNQALVLGSHLCPGVLGVRKMDQKHLECPSLYHTYLRNCSPSGCMPSTEHFYPHCLSAFWWLLTSRECVSFTLFLPWLAFSKPFGMATHSTMEKPSKHSF